MFTRLAFTGRAVQPLSAPTVVVAQVRLYAAPSGTAKIASKKSTVKKEPVIKTFTKAHERTVQRTGVFGVKLGMTRFFDPKTGLPVPLTALHIKDCQVLSVKDNDRDGYTALQVAAINVKDTKVNSAQRGAFAKAGIAPKRHIGEFRVTPDAILPVGTTLTADHFVPGQFVDVRAVTIGKGFQGVMKRHNMKGMPASHGVSLTHRAMGGSGAGQDPGRIWPGKRMAGHMGTVWVIQYGLQVFKVDKERSVLFLKGSVPGHKNCIVKIDDSRRKVPIFDVLKKIEAGEPVAQTA